MTLCAFIYERCIILQDSLKKQTLSKFFIVPSARIAAIQTRKSTLSIKCRRCGYVAVHKPRLRLHSDLTIYIQSKIPFPMIVFCDRPPHHVFTALQLACSNINLGATIHIHDTITPLSSFLTKSMENRSSCNSVFCWKRIAITRPQKTSSFSKSLNTSIEKCLQDKWACRRQ